MNSGIDRYLHQKNDNPLYVFPASVIRRKFFTVASAAEAKKYKLSIPKAVWSIGTTESSKQTWADRQKYQPDDKTKTQIALIKGYRKYLKAQEKLEKMERGADAPKAAELDTTKA
jgi:hypothetical protein